MSSLVIIKTGDAFPEVVDAHGDFEQLFIQQLRKALPETLTLSVWDARDAIPAMPAASYAGVIITGSHSMVSEAPTWSEALKPWLRQALANEVPMLGVCYGHQLMAAAFDGISDYHPARPRVGHPSGAPHPGGSGGSAIRPAAGVLPGPPDPCPVGHAAAARYHDSGA
ncbi:MAG: glutamine amidotransferase-related protein [Pseudomonadota bacterium]